MLCHPNCPYYNQLPPCGYMCNITAPPRKQHVAKPHPHPPHHPHPPPPHVEAIQSVRVIRTSNNPSPRSSTSRLQQKRHNHSNENAHSHGHVGADKRRVHFTPPHSHHLTHIRDISPYPSTSVRHSITPRPPIHGLPPPPPPPLPQAGTSMIPTIYILTFATDSYPNTPTSLARLLGSQLPANVKHLYTLDLRALAPPPNKLCAVYSGISPVLQDAVMSSPVARKLVAGAVKDLLSSSSAGGSAGGGKEGIRGPREVSMSVCCHAGTHRSVAVGERIAQGVKAEVGKRGGEGVRVVVRHVSRVRGNGDPF